MTGRRICEERRQRRREEGLAVMMAMGSNTKAGERQNPAASPAHHPSARPINVLANCQRVLGSYKHSHNVAEMSRGRTLVQVVAGRKEGVPLARNTR
ncbi:hypothetical protein GALMADRAFT_259526 [Galerina marginata CBS 339.88]|uniref:Uncharacterized protein n=1 Tax=Galerina marginata (strain CBS 339.88) TaxID=685588 RepID=A0A067S909_GALM3|nr:hypothetical protein GALMADRAFT_259526 [Galerina marginata CBS 339.88]